MKNIAGMRNVLNYKYLKYCEGNVLSTKGTQLETEAQKELTKAKQAFDDDGHSGGSYFWTRDQSQIVDNIGWEKWLQTPDAINGYRGIGVSLGRLMQELDNRDIVRSGSKTLH